MAEASRLNVGEENDMGEVRLKEDLRCAEESGEQALASLYAVRAKLNSAKKWGILDIFGGNLISSYVKHSKINEVEGLIEQSRMKLTDFQKTLRGVEIPAELKMEVSSFLTFADFAFDNPVTDYLVQTKLQTLGEEVEDTIQLMETLLEHIREQLEKGIETNMSLSNNHRATILFRIFYAGADAIQGESLLSIRQYPVKT